jgi:membrane protease YdiL (CAAX protease family)
MDVPFLLNWKHLPFSFVPSEALIHLVLIFLGPGLLEEGLFRGLVFRQFLEMTTWLRAGLYSGGFFALTHLGNLVLGYPPRMVLNQMLHCVLVSILLGYIVWKLNGNIWACVAFHTFDNLYAAIFIADQDLQQNLVLFAILGILSLILAFGGAIVLLRRSKEK